MAKKKKDDLKKDDENLEDENLQDDADSDDESNDDEENLSDEQDDQEDDKDDAADDDESDDDDADQTVSADAYKSLQRTIAKRDKAIKEAEDKQASIQEELDELRNVSDSGDIVKADLEKRFREQGQRLADLENENKQSKEESMQSRIIMEDFPELAKMKAYIPTSETEDEFRENCKKFAEDLGEKVTEKLADELDNSTPPVDEQDKKPSQAAVDALYEKAMSLAGDPKKEAEYNKVMDDYLKALDKMK